MSFKFCIRTFFYVISTALLLVNNIYAANPFEDRLCLALVAVSSGPIKVASIVAVLGVGAGMFMGKLSWPVALITVTALIVVNQAGAIVNLATGQSVDTCLTQAK